MKSITFESENCNIWNKKDFSNPTDTGISDLGCCSCSAYGTLRFVRKYSNWCWEIDIPYNWQYGTWEELKLHPEQVQIILMECQLCGELHRVSPSFILKGTTLTQTALIFVTFLYESSALTWRALPGTLCDAYNKIAHSTLYKAVHGLGKSLLANKAISRTVSELVNRYLSPLSPAKTWPKEKSHYPHTLEQEQSLRQTLLPLLGFDRFISLFYQYLRPLSKILLRLIPPVSKLYPRQRLP